MPRLHHLVCESQLASPLSLPELTAVAKAAQTYMNSHQITGLLMYRPDGHFLYLLEGAESALQALLQESVLRALQPVGCSVVSGGPWARRSFPDWRISTAAGNPVAGSPLPEALSFQELVTLLPQLAPNRPALVHRLLEFVEQYIE